MALGRVAGGAIVPDTIKVRLFATQTIIVLDGRSSASAATTTRSKAGLLALGANRDRRHPIAAAAAGQSLPSQAVQVSGALLGIHRDCCVTRAFADL
jgi:hypothetical protein